ncbi:hypothetical protein Dimus_023697 [Dionaea muscipula]
MQEHERGGGSSPVLSLGSRGERNNDNLWSQSVADEAHHVDQNTRNPSRKACSRSSGTNNESLVGLVASGKQVRWRRSLSTRGRVSIPAAVYVDYRPQQQGPQRRQKPAIPKDPFSRLLQECGQSSPCTLLGVFSNFCDPGQIVKIGEGTYGEAFIAGGCVCKIVPIDGDLRVNGELQKRSTELLEEVVLSRTLNCLRRHESGINNATTTFVETKDLRVCQGRYDPSLIRAWEAWDEKNGSENDHPQQFREKQCYVVFVLEHGGTDLESFVLLDFNEARSLVVQVTAALAVAEAEYEFEHRDLHWGNILLSRKEVATLQLILEGKSMLVKTNGLLVSIVDFTLSRMKAGDTILYLDLSSDPELFKGERGNKQTETYRKMRVVTDDHWKGSFLHSSRPTADQETYPSNIVPP